MTSTSKRERKRAIAHRPLPLGPGLVARVIDCDDAILVHIAGILAGYDNLGSMHGDGSLVAVITTQSQANGLDEVLASLQRTGLAFRVRRLDAISPEAAD
ncbi:MAG: hypothetical protein Q8Q09_23500 [Deltaproteobacteria bacterium]|nr:hypothetical protein [Deltaproteobacteria bacterium]